MIPDANRTAVIEAVTASAGPAKAEIKIQSTRRGAVIVTAGVAAAFVAFILMARMVWTGGEITLFGLILVGMILGFGLFLCILGAHQWSSEYTNAAVKDFLSLFGGVSKLWRKNGAEA